ncbi:hypothetical protein BsIDN1_61610 [Bacillus safensis]|uniref:Pyruvate phosphate dikinase AMP/ATP-binding domain-containing protein n=1 Tax=Bacillus safensis TaxID=561879 RepID=A0A5S9MHH1_BACIA|nr:hypothetical protein BsIDN1_61610 [Bacillus safensis]
MAGQFCLNDDQLKEITQITKQVEELYGHGVDIEFGIAGGLFYLLQARPITTALPKAVNETAGASFQMKPEELQDFWISMDDHMPGPTSPLFFKSDHHTSLKKRDEEKWRKVSST